MFEKNSFIKWSSSDEEGTFFIIGKVVNINEESITFVDKEGIVYSVPLDDGKLVSVNKPKNWKTNIVDVQPVIVPVQPKTKRKRKTSGKTKLDEVVEFLGENRDLINNRKKAIDKIVEVIGMTPKGASTYFSNAKNLLN